MCVQRLSLYCSDSCNYLITTSAVYGMSANMERSQGGESVLEYIVLSKIAWFCVESCGHVTGHPTSHCCSIVGEGSLEGF